MIIAGNWKLNKSPKETRLFLSELDRETKELKQGQFIVFPPAVSLEACAESLKNAKINWGCQNISTAESGAFTGETSVNHVLEMGAGYTLIGHSERRSLFKESNAEINIKVKLSLSKGVKPMLCIGETLKQREASDTQKVLNEQLDIALKEVKDLSNVVIAYEPVWAIGTGVVASLAQVAEAHKFIRQNISKNYDAKTSESIKILYGGSVKPANCKELSETPGVDGFLIGGASLKIDSFVEIYKKTN